MCPQNGTHVAVIGAGNMGHGIAQVAAMSGYHVTLRDIEQSLVRDGYESIEWSLEKLAEKSRLDEPAGSVLERIETEVDLETAVESADLVVEAIPEKMELKRELFEDLAEYAPEHAVLASNTSSLSITDIGSATDRPEQVVGTHFFNPPVKMELVELVHGEETSEESIEAAETFVESVGKTPIHVKKDIRGFVVNNVLLPFMMEAAWMVSRDEAAVEEVDAAMVSQCGYPMGPFELADLTGLDIGYDVYEEAGRPVPPALEERVGADKLGKKTGSGYYDYDEGEGVTYEAGDSEGFDTLRIEARMVNAAAHLVGDGVATPEDVDTGMRLGAGFPEGICRRGDELGLDVVLDTLRSLHEETGADRYAPDPYLVGLVTSDKTGVDAGEGFYRYDQETLGEYQFLNHGIEDGILTVQIARPERYNALSETLRGELVHLFRNASEENVRCVTIEGVGDRAFSSGADVGELRDKRASEMMNVSESFEAVASFSRPVIAKIDGLCLGAGFEVALACDLRLATERSTFGFPEIGLGLIPGGGGTQRLLRLVGPTRTKELVYRGNRISAERAEEWGIINRAVPAEEFEETVATFVDDICTGPPVALQVAKRVIDSGGDADLEAGLVMESQGFGLLIGTEDSTTGIDAFLNDRDADFAGR